MDRMIESGFRRSMLAVLWVALASVAALSENAFAANLAPIAATSQSNYGPRPPQNAIDGTGMIPNNPVTSASIAGNAPDGNMWLSNGNVNTWIAFDLGSVVTINGFHLWNYNEGGNYPGRGVKTCGIYSLTSMPAQNGPYSTFGGTLVQNMTFQIANGANNNPGNGDPGLDYFFTPGTTVTTRYILMYVLSNFGTSDSYTGISEIRFNDVTATLTGVSPAGDVLAGGTTITLTGTGFKAGSTITFGSVNGVGGVAGTSPTFVNATTYTVVAPPHAAGTVEVTMTDVNSIVSTLTGAFVYANNPPPGITSVSPALGSIGGGTPVTISGVNFRAGATVSFGGTNGFNTSAPVTPTSINTYTSKTNTALSESGNVVTVTTTTNHNLIVGQSIAIAGVVPGGYNGIYTVASVPTATTFTYTAIVNGLVAATTFGTVTPLSTITVVTPPADPSDASGPTAVTVTNSDNTFGTLDSSFNYKAPAPTVTLIQGQGNNPNGPYNAVTPVTITGTGFSSNFASNLASQGKITLGGQPVIVNSVQDDQTLLGLVQPIAAGIVNLTNDIVVTNPDGNSSAITGADHFTYNGLVPADPDTNLQNKVFYRYYNNTSFGPTLPGYPNTTFPLNITPFSTGFASAMNFNQTNPFQSGVANNWAVEYAGMLNVPADGIYTFYLASDDTSVMRINSTNSAFGSTIVCNVNNSSATGTPIGLKAGLHRFNISYAEGVGGYYLTAQWSSGFFAREDIPQGVGSIPQGAATNSALTEAGNVVTVTTSTNHNLFVGQSITIAGVVPAGYNGNYTVTSVPTATTFTYTDAVTGLANATTFGTFVPTTYARGFYGESPLVVTSAIPNPSGALPQTGLDVDDNPIPITITGSGFGSYVNSVTILQADGVPVIGGTFTNPGTPPNSFIVANSTTLNGFNAPANPYEGIAPVIVSTYSGQSVTLPGGLPNGLYYDTSDKTFTWTGGANTPNWSDGANWDKLRKPDFFAYVILTNAGMKPTNQDIAIPGGFPLTSITYNPGVPSFVLSGQPINFDTQPAAITIDPSSPSQTINANTIISVPTIVSTGVGATHQLTLLGNTSGIDVLTVSSGSTVQFGNFGGAATANGLVSINMVANGSVIIADPFDQLYTGNLSGTGTLTVNSGGILTLTGASTFSGGTTVAAGTLLIRTPFGANGIDPMGTGPVTLSGGLLRLAGQPGSSAPIALAPSSFNYDLFAEANATSPQSGTTTSYASWVYYEKGAPNTAQGLPAGNPPFTSQFNPLVQFQLAPYSGGANVISKNALILGPGVSSDFTLATPASYQALQLLYNCSGAANFSATVKFSDNSQTLLTGGTTVPDWTQAGPIAITNIGLIQDYAAPPTGPGWSSGGLYANQLSMFEQDYALSLTDQAKTIVSVTLTGNSGNPVFFALSGVPLVGGPALATQSYNNGLILTTDSTVDVVNSLNATLGGTLSTIGNHILTLTGTNVSLTLGNGALKGNLTLNVPSAANQLTVGATADAVGFGPNSLTKTGPGTLLFGGISTYGGATNVQGGTVRLGKNGVPAGSVLWLNANDTTKMLPANAVAGTVINTWTDELSGNNVSGTGTYQPNVINGQAVIRFAAPDKMSNLTNYPAPTSVFVVERYTGGNNQRILSSIKNNWLLGMHGNLIDRYYYEGWVSGNGGNQKSGTAADTLPHMYEATISSNGSTASVFDARNLASVVLRDANTFGITGPNGIGLNSGYQNGGEQSSCDIAEVLIYPSVLNAATLAQVEAYLAEKYFGASLPGGLKGSLPANTDLTLSAGTTFDVNGGTQTIGSLSGAASASVTLGTGTLTVGGGTASTTFPGIISGVGGSFGKQGSYNLKLTGANTYTGNTTVGAGTGSLSVGNVNAIPSGAGNGNVIVNGNLDLNGFNIGVNGLSGIGFVDNFGAAAVTLTVGNNNATASFSGVIRNSVGAVSLTKTGSGVQSLQNASTYAGSTTIAAGTLQLITLQNNYQAYNIAAANGAQNQQHPGSLGYDFTVNRPVTVTDLGFFQPTNAAYTAFTHTVNISNQTNTTIFATANVTTANTLTNGYRFALISPITLNPGIYRIWGNRFSDGDFNNSTVQPGPLVDGGGALTFAPPNRGYFDNTAGTFPTVNPDNSNFTPNTPYRYGAVSFKFNDPSAITGTGQLPSATALTIMNGSTFDLNNINQTIGSLSATDASGNKVTLGTGTLTVGNSALTTFDGIISGAGGALVKQGTGTLTLTGSSTYSGTTTVNAGSLAVNGATGQLVSASTATATGALRGTGTVLAQTNTNGGGIWPGIALGGGSLAANEMLTVTKFVPAANGKLKIALNNSFQQKLVVTTPAATPVDLSTTTLQLGITNGTNRANILVLDMTNGATDNITKPFQAISVNGNGAQAASVTVTYMNHSNAIVTPANTLATDANRVFVSVNGGAVTPVTVASFTASAQGAGVLLEWNCLSEFQNAGFNVYRRPLQEPRTPVSGQSDWVRVNPALIAGRISSPDARTYRLYDWAAPGQYVYKLDSISIQGDAETYAQIAGPVDVGGNRATGALTPEGVAAAIASVDAANNTTVTQELSGKFAAAGNAQPNPASNKNTGNDTGAQFDRNAATRAVAGPAGLALNSDGTLVRPATVKFIDIAGGATAVSSRAVEVATRSASASSGMNSMAAARWFSSSSVNNSSTFNAAKVVYNQAGVLLIPQASLPAGININHLAVQREGRAIPALAVTPDGLLVFGQGYEDDYTANDALFLRSTSGPTAAGQATHAQGLFAGAQVANLNSPATVTVDYHDVYFDYNDAFRPYTFAPWFSSQYLTADAATGTTQSFTIDTPYASSSPATLTVNVWSLTQSETAAQDHAMQVLVNGQPAGQAVWGGGNKMVQLTFNVPSGALKTGANQIDLVTPPIADVDSQIAFLHSITVAYTRTLDGSTPVTIYNTGTSNQLFELSGVPSANAWVVDARFPDRAALVPYEAQDQGDGTYKVRFTASGGGTGQYQVVPAGMENAPLSVTRRQVKPLKLTGVYLATGPSQFSAGIQPLLMQRAKEGLRGQFVDQEQLFDYYNYGRYGPTGIQNAVRATQPQYLLLLGRTTYDYKNYSGLNVDPLCPAFLVSTTFWAQATSDSMFGDLGRGYAEVAVGRLPVNNAAELSVAVKHILNYKGAPASGARIHAVADQADPLVANFPAQADIVSQSFPDSVWQPNYLGVTYQTAPEVTNALATAANGGADWIVYIGHGNAVGLGNASPKILDTTSVQAWMGDVVLLQSTCTANWMAKNVDDYKSIAIQALTQPQGGISASIGTSTYMDSDYAVPFLTQLMKNADSGGMRWGNALMKTQQWAASQGPGFYADLAATEQIFGDPAMPVFSKKPATEQPPTGTPPPGPGPGPGPIDSATPAPGTF